MTITAILSVKAHKSSLKQEFSKFMELISNLVISAEGGFQVNGVRHFPLPRSWEH